MLYARPTRWLSAPRLAGRMAVAVLVASLPSLATPLACDDFGIAARVGHDPLSAYAFTPPDHECDGDLPHANPASSIDTSFAAFNITTVERWAVSADHDPYRRPEGLRAVGVGLQGTVIEALIAQHDGGYIDELVSGCPKNGCNALTLPTAVAGLLAVDPPPPRHGYAAAMSGTARRLWLGGGVDGAGAAMTDIWEYDLAEQLWRQLPVSRDGRVGAVLAIAWSSPARAVYVLDRVTVDHHRSAVRLLRIDPAGDDLVIEQRFDANDMRADRYELAVGVEDDAWIVQSDLGSHATYSAMHLVRAAPAAEHSGDDRHGSHDCDDDHDGHAGDGSTSTSAAYLLASRDEGRGEVLAGAVSADRRGLSLLVRRDGNLASVGLAARADSHDGAHHR
jgi:hypothetical protein